jgi:hypothetical protein
MATMHSPVVPAETQGPLAPRAVEKAIAINGIDALGEEARPIDPEIERRVLRKIDLFLMPAMVIGTWIFVSYTG